MGKITIPTEQKRKIRTQFSAKQLYSYAVNHDAVPAVSDKQNLSGRISSSKRPPVTPEKVNRAVQFFSGLRKTLAKHISFLPASDHTKAPTKISFSSLLSEKKSRKT